MDTAPRGQLPPMLVGELAGLVGRSLQFLCHVGMDQERGEFPSSVRPEKSGALIALLAIRAASVAIALAAGLLIPVSVVAIADPMVETVCRGIERRIKVLTTYSARLYEKKFLPPQELADYVVRVAEAC